MFLKETTAFFLYLSLIYGGSQEGNLLRVKQRAKQSGTNHSQIRFTLVHSCTETPSTE